jgi:uncharacterized protein YyaL (SSP411 family)
MSNRLQNATSPYLLQHAENPVNWFEWGEDALLLAKNEDKPIFLSIGYAACHWCHVMAHESFEDEATASVMNERFINIKVDREERPDLDTIYMDAVVAMTGQGGWPMSVFLTPDGTPFFGGTYFPPTRRHGLPGFHELLLQIAHVWQSDRARLLGSGEQLAEYLKRDQLSMSGGGEADASLLEAASSRLHDAYDWSHGGWGAAPKFPQATSIDFLLDRYVMSGDKLARDMATHALKAMAVGGIYDQLGGGFARYAVDRDWQVPHFEKMLYDNALLLASYLKAWQVTSDPLFRRIAEETFEFLMREMRHHEGGFFSSLDADSEGEEGKFYVWTNDEIRDVVGDGGHAEMILDHYGVLDGPNFEGANVLRAAHDRADLVEAHSLSPEEVSDALHKARDALFQHRLARIRPGLDDKILTSWNGMLLQALSLGAQATGDHRWYEAAGTLAEFLLSELLVEGQLLHSWRDGRARFNAYLEDQAALGLGWLELYATEFEPRWYRAAVDRAHDILEHYTDEAGGFFDTSVDHENLITRPQSTQDTPTPSGRAGVAADGPPSANSPDSLCRLAPIIGIQPRGTAAAGISG